jgi:hypothetical protein
MAKQAVNVLDLEVRTSVFRDGKMPHPQLPDKGLGGGALARPALTLKQKASGVGFYHEGLKPPHHGGLPHNVAQPLWLVFLGKSHNRTSFFVFGKICPSEKESISKFRPHWGLG